MSKKGAPKGKSGKRPKSGKGKKTEIEAEDALLINLRRTIEEYRQQNSDLRENVTYYRDKLHAIVQHVLDVNVDGYKPPKGIALVDVPESDVKSMVTNITITPNSSLRAYEVRLEELETRITQLSSELAKLLKMKLKVENGLKDMERMYTVEDLRVQGKRLWYECCSTHIFVTPKQVLQESSISNGGLHPDVNVLEARPMSGVSGVSGMSNLSATSDVSGMTGVSTVTAMTEMSSASRVTTTSNQEPEIPSLYLNLLNPKARSINLTPRAADKFDLDPPEKKLPGDTHIFDMHQGLRSLIIRQLSKRKGNSSDWRLIAYRVGIPEALVEQWEIMRSPHSMALVMKVWGDSMGATVRMLHRHLSSPQMKAVVLAKRMSDFYDID